MRRRWSTLHHVTHPVDVAGGASVSTRWVQAATNWRNQHQVVPLEQTNTPIHFKHCVTNEATKTPTPKQQQSDGGGIQSPLQHYINVNPACYEDRPTNNLLVDNQPNDIGMTINGSDTPVGTLCNPPFTLLDYRTTLKGFGHALSPSNGKTTYHKGSSTT